MQRLAAVLACAALIVVGIGGPASAVTITPIFSWGDGFGTLTWSSAFTIANGGACAGVPPCTGAAVATFGAPIPPWQAEVVGGRQWVSVAGITGTDGFGPNNRPSVNFGDENATFIYHFHLASASLLSLRIWADDTADLRIDGGGGSSALDRVLNPYEDADHA